MSNIKTRRSIWEIQNLYELALWKGGFLKSKIFKMKDYIKSIIQENKEKQ